MPAMNKVYTVLYSVAEQRDDLRQLTNHNMKPDSCKKYKNLKHRKHQLGSIYTDVKKSNTTNLEWVLREFKTLFPPGIKMQSVSGYIT